MEEEEKTAAGVIQWIFVTPWKEKSRSRESRKSLMREARCEWCTDTKNMRLTGWKNSTIFLCSLSTQDHSQMWCISEGPSLTFLFWLFCLYFFLFFFAIGNEQQLPTMNPASRLLIVAAYQNEERNTPTAILLQEHRGFSKWRPGPWALWYRTLLPCLLSTVYK